MEYDTNQRFGMNKVIGVIGNDACWSQIKRDQVKILESDVATNLDYSSYENIGKCFGISGEKITGEKQLVEYIDKIQNSNKSYIINAIIDKSDFREGSASFNICLKTSFNCKGFVVIFGEKDGVDGKDLNFLFT